MFNKVSVSQFSTELLEWQQVRTKLWDTDGASRYCGNAFS